MKTEMERTALAARDAHLALVDLRKLVDEAARTTHAVELEAVHLAISSKPIGDIASMLASAVERLGSTDFEASLNRARQSLRIAIP